MIWTVTHSFCRAGNRALCRSRLGTTVEKASAFSESIDSGNALNVSIAVRFRERSDCLAPPSQSGMLILAGALGEPFADIDPVAIRISEHEGALAIILVRQPFDDPDSFGVADGIQGGRIADEHMHHIHG